MMGSMLAMLSVAALPEVHVGSEGAVLVGDGNDRFGYQTEAADLDGDGSIDLVVAAPHPNGNNAVYVFYGPHDLANEQLDTSDAGAVIEGPSGSENGWSIATGDLLRGDGTELVIGSPVEGGANGMVHVFAGPLAPATYATTDATITIEGTGGGYLGWSVAAGDFDGDGLDELAAGACAEGLGGRAYLLDLDVGDPVDADDATAVFEGAGLTGCSIANAGDFNGDGFEDLLIGSHGASAMTGRNYGGAVSLVYGRSSFDHGYDLLGDEVAQDIAHLVAENLGENFGYDVAPAGDVNADGYADILIGAPAFFCRGTCAARDRKGAAYLVLGTKDVAPGGGIGRGLFGTSVGARAADVVWEAAGNDDRTGVSVAAAGFAGETYTLYDSTPGNTWDGLGPVLMFGSKNDFAYAMAYDRVHRLHAVPRYKCVPVAEWGWTCELGRDNVPPARQERRDLGLLTSGGHRFVGDAGTAFGLEVFGPGDLDGDGDTELMFGAPDQVNAEDSAGDGEAFVFPGL